MGNNVFDSPVDPFDSDNVPNAALYHVQSVGKSGPFLDIVAPSGHNYPQAGSSTRTFIELPMVIDQSDLAGSYPIIVTDETGGAGTLTRAAASPAAGEYRIPNTTASLRGHVIEINSAEWGETISFDYYGKGTVLNKVELDPIDDIIGLRPHTTQKSVYGFESAYRDSLGNETVVGLKHKVIEMGDWNMNSTTTLTLAHGLGTAIIISISGIIIDDIGATWQLNRFGSSADPDLVMAGVSSYNSTNVFLGRRAGSAFDSVNFDSTSFNRGYIYITYFV